MTIHVARVRFLEKLSQDSLAKLKKYQKLVLRIDSNKVAHVYYMPFNGAHRAKAQLLKAASFTKINDCRFIKLTTAFSQGFKTISSVEVNRND